MMQCKVEFEGENQNEVVNGLKSNRRGAKQVELLNNFNTFVGTFHRF